MDFAGGLQNKKKVKIVLLKIVFIRFNLNFCNYEQYV